LPPPCPSTYSISILFIDIVLGLIILLILAIVITAVCALWSRVPYVPTSKKIARTMIHEAALRKGEVVYDLGAGDGRLLIGAKRAEPTITAKGYELVPVVWLFAKMWILLSRVDVDIRWGNALSKDVRDADCIFLYLIPSVMKKLGQKFDRELRPGTRVISHAFTFPGKTPVREVVIQKPYGETKLYIYKW